ncbi:MAG: hypothetical protein ACRDT8_17625 [Micromonosporaceae bacterium]
MREVVESWWNGYHGSMARARVRLCRNGMHWSVEREGPRQAYEETPCFNENQARAEVQRLLSEVRPAAWRRVDRLNKPAGR